MAEAEDVITDVARHATIFAQDLWRRHRTPRHEPSPILLIDVSRRIHLLISALFDTPYVLRAAQVPAPPTLLSKLFNKGAGARCRQALPATDGVSIWLPPTLNMIDPTAATARYRILALQQAMRAHRGSASLVPQAKDPLVRDLYLLLEAYAADEHLARRLPGTIEPVNALRQAALAARPALHRFPSSRRALEALVRVLLQQPCGRPTDRIPLTHSPAQSLDAAQRLANELAGGAERTGNHPLLLDWWTGELRAPPAAHARLATVNDDVSASDTKLSRSARLSRRPKARESNENEDDPKQGAWMIQTTQPHEQAEDPTGLQRPTDRDEYTAAEEFADALSELPEARLVSAPGRAKEVLLSDDPPDARAQRDVARATADDTRIVYPEWDYRQGVYREAGATVRVLPASYGPQAWIDRTLVEHRAMLALVRRHFEMLRAQRARLRRQLDGDDLDLEAYIDSYSDFRAGQSLTQRWYQTQHPARQALAIMLAIDVSGSTDAWISTHRRVIDVEREALLLVSAALQGLGEAYAAIAFSGEGPQAVTVRTLKQFNEPYGNDIARRIAALEPEHYTRAGAAIRHASALLMREPAAHRLLLLLSDGKPNDIDRYEGRYGVEDMRQAVVETKLQGIFPFCLTIDRQGASYIPYVFGAGQYAMLPKPELLPTVLLDYMKRLVTLG